MARCPVAVREIDIWPILMSSPAIVASTDCRRYCGPMSCSVGVVGHTESLEVALDANEVKQRLYAVHDDPNAVVELPLVSGGTASIAVADFGLIIPDED